MRRRLLAIAAAGALTAACGATPSDGPMVSAPARSAAPAVPAVPGIEAEAVRLRTDEAIGGQVQVRITDTGDAPFTVTSVALDSPGFTTLPATRVTAQYAPGRVIDLPTPFGTAVCGRAAEPAAARVTVVRPGGATEQLRIPLGAEILDRIHREECAVQGVLAVVDISLARLRIVGDAATGDIALRRRTGSDQVTVVRLLGSVLMDATARGLPRVMKDGDSALAVPVSFTLASCDPHVLAETKQPYLFPLAVRVGNRAEVSVHLPVDAATATLFAALVDQVCKKK